MRNITLVPADDGLLRVEAGAPWRADAGWCWPLMGDLLTTEDIVLALRVHPGLMFTVRKEVIRRPVSAMRPQEALGDRQEAPAHPDAAEGQPGAIPRRSVCPECRGWSRTGCTECWGTGYALVAS